jgi:hypothetical protein
MTSSGPASASSCDVDMNCVVLIDPATELVL